MASATKALPWAMAPVPWVNNEKPAPWAGAPNPDAARKVVRKMNKLRPNLAVKQPAPRFSAAAGLDGETLTSNLGWSVRKNFLIRQEMATVSSLMEPILNPPPNQLGPCTSILPGVITTFW